MWGVFVADMVFDFRFVDNLYWRGWIGGCGGGTVRTHLVFGPENIEG
jgi:hypothetical protein